MLTVYKCTHCDQIFYSQSDCETHQKNGHPEMAAQSCVPVRYRCPVCGQILAHESDCKNHALREHRRYIKDCEEIVEELPQV